MQLTQSLIDEIIQKTNIVEIVGDYVQLEKKGRNYVGLCPFHADTNPSMSVSEEKHIFKCFSCGAGGNAIKFVQDFEQISFPDAARKVAERVGITIDIRRNPFEKYYQINKAVTALYKVNLLNTVQGKEAQQYLSSRGISLETIKNFEIGLAPVKNTIYEALRKQNFEPLDMITAGVVYKDNDQYVDVFKNRIIFPIKDKNGNIVGFSGRALSKDAKAKYINSAESVIFKKSKLLYHFQEAKRAAKISNRVVLMEGYMDVIAAAKAGVEDTVATMGTALTKEHATLLKSITNKVTICFDGDSAGVEAAFKSINTLRDFEVKVVILPNGLDPDDFIKEHGNDEFKKYLNEKALDMFNFVYQYYLNKTDPNNISDLERFKRQIFKLIQGASNVQVEWYLNKLAQTLNVSMESVVNDFKINRQATFTEVKEEKRGFPKYFRAEVLLVKYMTSNKDRALTLNEHIGHDYIDDSNNEIRMKLISYYRANPVFVEENFMSNLSIKLQEHYKSFIKHQPILTSSGVNDCVKTIKEYPFQLKLDHLKKRSNGQVTLEEANEMLKIKKSLGRGK